MATTRSQEIEQQIKELRTQNLEFFAHTDQRFEGYRRLNEQQINDLKIQSEHQNEELRRALHWMRDQSTNGGENGQHQERNHSENNGGCHHNNSGMGKLKLPKFDGEEVGAWLYRCQQYFDFYSTPEESKIKTVSMNMEGSALYWHQTYMRSKLMEGVYPRWIDYAREISTTFSKRPYENPCSDIKNLSQTGTLQEYIKEFDCLFSKTELREEVAVGMFIRGLRKEIQSLSLMLQPHYLRDAYALARKQEDNYDKMCATVIGNKHIFHSIQRVSFTETKPSYSYGAKFSSAKPIPTMASGLLPLPANAAPINEGQGSRFRTTSPRTFMDMENNSFGECKIEADKDPILIVLTREAIGDLAGESTLLQKEQKEASIEDNAFVHDASDPADHIPTPRLVTFRESSPIKVIPFTLDPFPSESISERDMGSEESIVMASRNFCFIFRVGESKAKRFDNWAVKLHQQPCHVAYTGYQPSQLQNYIFKMIKKIIQCPYDPGIRLILAKRGCEILAMRMVKLDLHEEGSKFRRFKLNKLERCCLDQERDPKSQEEIVLSPYACTLFDAKHETPQFVSWIEEWQTANLFSYWGPPLICWTSWTMPSFYILLFPSEEPYYSWSCRQPSRASP